MGLMQYLRDTRGELRHVAWPTRMQTLVFTGFVIFLSIVVAVYLGIFDYLFTMGLERTLEVMGVVPAPAVDVATTTAEFTSTSTPISVE